MKPFPQFKTGNKELPALWEEYRQRMIRLAGIAIFIFGNKLDKDNKVVLANGVKREFEIAVENGLIPIPVSTTNYMASELYNEISKDFKTYYAGHEDIVSLVEDVSQLNPDEADEIISKIVQIIEGVNR